MSLTTHLRIAQIVPSTEAEGPGKRFAIWVQGCPLRCAECCNPEMLAFEGGTEILVSDLIDQILQSQSSGIEGITLIGGEPFAHADALVSIAAAAHRANLSVMVFSGYTLAELNMMDSPAVHEFLRHIDLLVDGRYDRTKPDTRRRWIGSTNQQIHFLTDRYSPNDAIWTTPDTLELHWDGRELVVNGFPAKSAVGLWNRNAFRESAP